MKKILAILIAMTMLLSVQIPVFADETTTAQPAATQETTTTQPAPETQPPATETTTTTTDAGQTTQTQNGGTTTTEVPSTSTPATTTTTDTTTPVQTTATPDPAAQTGAVTTTTTTTTTTTEVQPTQQPGITPDSPFYVLDKLMEKIQLALITDAVKEAAELAKISQERLAESYAMLEKADVELSQKALEEYKTSLDKAVTLVQTAMEDGKEVATVMDGITAANLKDAAVVQKIMASIPEEYKAEVTAEIEKVAATVTATNETAQVVENKEEENEDSLKLDMTMKFIEEKVKDAALIAKIKEAGLNTRQIIAVISLSEQSEKPLAEVLDLFIKNEKGLGATAHELGLSTKDALKGINGSFKEAKDTIKKAFKEAIKVVEDEDKEAVETIVNNSLTGQTAAAAETKAVEEVKAVNKKLDKVVKEAKTQVEAITAATAAKKAEEKVDKEADKIEKAAEKAVEKVEKATEKAADKVEKAMEKKADKDADDDKDNDDDDDKDDDNKNEDKSNNGKKNKN